MTGWEAHLTGRVHAAQFRPDRVAPAAVLNELRWLAA